jgi:hypothetical protein
MYIKSGEKEICQFLFYTQFNQGAKNRKYHKMENGKCKTLLHFLHDLSKKSVVVRKICIIERKKLVAIWNFVGVETPTYKIYGYKSFVISDSNIDSSIFIFYSPCYILLRS